MCVYSVTVCTLCVCARMTQTSIQNMEKNVQDSCCGMHLLQQISYVINTKLLLLFFICIIVLDLL